MSYHITFLLVFLNWTYFFLYYLHGIFLFWYDQACISLFRKKMRRIESKLCLSYFPLVDSLIFNVMNFVLIFPTPFLFKTYFCMKSYLKTFFLPCFYTLSSLVVIVCLINEPEIKHFMKAFPAMKRDRDLNNCFATLTC